MKRYKHRNTILAFTALLAPVAHAKDPTYTNTPQPISGLIEFENFVSANGSGAPHVQNPQGEVGHGESIRGIGSGTFVDYSVDIAETGSYKVGIRASGGGTRNIEFRFGGTVFHSFAVPDTNSEENFQTFYTNVDFNQVGQQTLTVRFMGDYSASHMNWMSFRKNRNGGSANYWVHVSPQGDDSGNGAVEDSPVRTLQRAMDRVAEIVAADPGHGPIVVALTDGYHELTERILLDSSHSGTSNGPIRIEARSGATPIVGMGRRVPSEDFSLVGDGPTLSRLKPSSHGKVYRVNLDDLDWMTRFPALGSKQAGCVSSDGALQYRAQFPNKGYFRCESVSSDRLSFIPRGLSGAGPAWQAEFNRTGDIFVRGSMEADEFEGFDAVQSIGSNGRVTLASGSTPLSTQNGNDRRAELVNVLYELDMPGEWYFDRTEGNFYIWPAGLLEGNPDIRVGGRFAGIEGVSGSDWIEFNNLIFQDVALGGLILRVGGENNRVSGCTFRSMSTVPFRASGRFNQFDSNNFTQVTSTMVINQNPNGLKKEESFVEFTNNHIWDMERSGYGGGAFAVNGGLFANNVFHNFQNGLAMQGADNTLFENNEFYDCGYRNGDWNPFYIGATWKALGNSFRHNFIHNMVSAPNRRRIGGFRADGDSAGVSAVGNVFYRAGNYAIALNAHGNTVNNNVVIDNSVGLLIDTRRNLSLNGTVIDTPAEVAAEIDRQINDVPSIYPQSLNTPMYNAVQEYGADYWDSSYFAYKYPHLARAFDINPFSLTDITSYQFQDNYTLNVPYKADSSNGPDVPSSRLAGALAAIEFSEEPVGFSRSNLVNEDTLDLRFDAGFSRQSGFYDIPFTEIGLKKQGARQWEPHKATYRAETKLRWDANGGVSNGNQSTYNNPYYDRNVQRKTIYDCGSYTSPLFQNTRLLTEQTEGGTAEYGWWPNASGVSVSTAGSGGNAFNIDALRSTQTKVFEQTVENGPWYVLVTFGDVNSARSSSIRAEDDLFIAANQNVATSAGQFVNRVLSTRVTDGRLSLEFSGDWAVTRIIVQRAAFSGPSIRPVSKLGVFEKGSDIDNPRFIGVTSGQGDSYTLQASGRDIWGTADQFHFSNKRIDGVESALSAKVTSLTNTHPWAKAGVMFRDNDSPGSRFVGVFVRPDGQVAMQWRTTQNANAAWTGQLVGGTGLPKYVRLFKNGNSYTGYYSTNGVNFTEITTVTLPIGNSPLGGLALTSHDDLKLATARFDETVIGDFPPAFSTGEFVDQEVYLWDFGSEISPLFTTLPGYRQITNLTRFGFVQWTDISGLSAADRAQNNDINRDFVFSSQPRTLRHQLRNGRYEITLNMWDAIGLHDDMVVKAEGITKLSNVDLGGNSNNANQIFTVEVTDGFLDLEFSDAGGSDPNWVVNRLIVRRLADFAVDVYNLDLGTAESPLFSGYLRVTPDTRSGIYRWADSGVGAVDRPGFPTNQVNFINRDLHFSSQNKTFEIGVENGTWDVVITFGDPSFDHDNYTATAEGVSFGTIDTNQSVGRIKTVTKRLNVTDGKITITFQDNGGSDPNWTATRIRALKR